MHTTASPPPKSVLAHMPQIDGLRTLAVGLVVVQHSFTALDAWPLGFLGVRLFFVISGFLITAGLLATRGEIDDGLGTTVDGIRNFYLRRSLRIFPIYYLLLIAVAVFGNADVRSRLVWLFTYLTNYDIVLRGNYDAPINHLWSLAVEEQFYLVWPWLILFVRRGGLGWVCGMAAFVGVVFRSVVVANGGSDVAATFPTPACLDGFAMGAWFAILRDRPPGDFSSPAHRMFVVGLAAVAGWLAIRYLAPKPLQEWHLVVGDSATAVVFGGSVALAALGRTGPAARLLSWPPTRYIGKVSYGIYLYHPFCLRPLHRFADVEGGIALRAIDGLAGMALSVLAAVVSWHLIERPINRWKDRFR
ncbi:MAG: acyltransferase [Gemmataceae bacterium]